MTNAELVNGLTEDGYLRSPAIIAAFQAMDRARFVPEERRAEAYGNYPLPIGHGQTISQPLTVAFMLELLEPKPGDQVLDVGCGSGWQTALLASVVGDAGRVVGIERIPELASAARKNLEPLGFAERKTVRFVIADGTAGFSGEAPYDKIIAAASGHEIPPAWKEQLKIGGRIVAPVGEAVVVVDKVGPSEYHERRYPGFVFVPLVTG